MRVQRAISSRESRETAESNSVYCIISVTKSCGRKTSFDIAQTICGEYLSRENSTGSCTKRRLTEETVSVHVYLEGWMNLSSNLRAIDGIASIK